MKAYRNAFKTAFKRAALVQHGTLLNYIIQWGLWSEDETDYYVSEDGLDYYVTENN